jgi:hypothetical protein
MSPEVERLIATHKDNIAGRLRELQRLVKAFSLELKQSTGTQQGEVPVRPVVVYAPITEPSEDPREPIFRGFKTLRTDASRRAAAEAYSQLDYLDEQLPNQSLKCYGIVGVPRRLINLAKRINTAKDELREAIAPVANRRVKIYGKNATGEQEQLVRELTTVILRQIQSSSVNLLAAYRELPIIDEPVDQIHFMLTRTRSVPRKTAQWVREKIMGDRSESELSPDAKDDLAALANIPDNEYLVCPKPPRTCMRAHVFLRRMEPNEKNNNKLERVRRIISADLPILFPMTATSVAPTVVAPKKPNPDRKHPASRIEANETVKTLHFFRMKEAYRVRA